MKTNWKIFVSVVITAVVVGGGVFYFTKTNVLDNSNVDNSNVDNSNVDNSKLKDSGSQITTNKADTVQLMKLSGFSDNEEILLQGKNLQKETSSSCMQDYVSGDFVLLLQATDTKKAIDEFDLGSLTVAPKDPLQMLRIRNENQPAVPFVSIQTYGSCNGDMFKIYKLPTKTSEKIVSAKFSGAASNELFADKINGVAVQGTPESGIYILVQDFYDNSIGKAQTVTYSFDGVSTFTKDKR